MRGRFVFFVVLSLVVLPCRVELAFTDRAAPPTSPSAGGDARTSTRIVRFEPNLGQAEASFRYVAEAGPITALLAADGPTLLLDEGRPARSGHAPEAPAPTRSTAIDMRFVGGSPSMSLEAAEPLDGVSNYIIGNDPERWQTGVPAFGRVLYRAVYPGIDVVFHSANGPLEYDFVIAPGADPSAIRVRFDGARSVELSDSGDLLIATALGDLVQRAPQVYQDTPLGRAARGARYSVAADGTVGVLIAAYDPSLNLVVDPAFVFSTYLSGSEFDVIEDVTTDYFGNLYVVGRSATNFPFRPQQPGAVTLGGDNVLVAKYAADTGTLRFRSLFGGSEIELAYAIALGPDESIYITGGTASDDFPSSPTAFQSTLAAGLDAFVLRIESDGLTVSFMTYLGGGGQDQGNDIEVDSAGNAHVVGYTDSADFPLQAPLPRTTRGSTAVDSFYAVTSASGNFLVRSLTFGGSDPDIAFGLELSNGRAYIAGLTGSADFPTVLAVQPMMSGPSDGFLTVFEHESDSPVFSTYVGGTDRETCLDVAVDTDGRPVVVGVTDSSDYPTQLPFMLDPGDGASDCFVTKYSGIGSMSEYLFSTYLGGNKSDVASAVAVDPDGNVYLTGSTFSTNFPTQNPIQPNLGGTMSDAFVTVINSTGSSLVHSTYLGGAGTDYGNGISTDDSFNAYVVGGTNSMNFPTFNAYDPSPDAGGDGFVTRIGNASADLQLEAALSVDPVPSGSQLTYSIDVSNAGPDRAGNVWVAAELPSGMDFVSVTVSQGNTMMPDVGASGTVVCQMGRLDPGEAASVSIVVDVNVMPGATATFTAVAHSTAVDAVVGNNGSANLSTVGDTVPPPVVTRVESLVVSGKPYRIRITGSNFQAGVMVFVGGDTTPWPSVKQKGTTKLVLKKGTPLKQRFPTGVAVPIRVANPDGGSVTVMFTR